MHFLISTCHNQMGIRIQKCNVGNCTVIRNHWTCYKFPSGHGPNAQFSVVMAGHDIFTALGNGDWCDIWCNGLQSFRGKACFLREIVDIRDVLWVDCEQILAECSSTHVLRNICELMYLSDAILRGFLHPRKWQCKLGLQKMIVQLSRTTCSKSVDAGTIAMAFWLSFGCWKETAQCRDLHVHPMCKMCVFLLWVTAWGATIIAVLFEYSFTSIRYKYFAKRRFFFVSLTSLLN